jgi:ketopantoate reductase
MEWEARNQVVCRCGREHGIATPTNDAITALLEASEGSRGI